MLFVRPDGTTVTHLIQVGPMRRATVSVNAVPGLAATAVSAIVTSTNGIPIVADRTMYWPSPQKSGGHNANGIVNPGTTWYFAEGATGYFDCYFLLFNPSPTASADVRLRFVRADGVTHDELRTVGPRRRVDVAADTIPALANTTFYTVVEALNGVDIVAERAMYWGTPWAGGHVTQGARTPNAAWGFAEGFTRADPGFAVDTFLLLANPNATAAQVRATFFTAAGEALTRDYVIPAARRLDVWINQIPELASASFATLLQTTNGVSFVAERSVYWGDAAWTDGHVSLGETSVGFLKWAFAEGQQGGPLGFETYYLLLNVNTQPVDVEATFLREDGTGVVRTVQIPPRARMDFRATDPELDGERFALFLRSLSSLKFYAERSVYWGPGWDGGHNAKGRQWSWAIGTPPAPPAVDAPVISPPPGTYANAVSVAIDAAPGASVRYTTDGTTPTQDSPLYGGPFLLDGLPTVKARAYAAGFAPSGVTTNSPYTFQVAGPVFDRTSGVYTSEVAVGVTSVTAGAAFQCGVDGAPLTPCVPPITLTASGSLRVQATKPGYADSPLTDSTYTIEVAPPAATPGGHTFEDAVSVAWASATSGAAIHYTTDGSEPTLSAPLYTGPLTLATTTTVKARAWKAGCDPSPVTTEVYTRAAVAAPVFTPTPPGPYVGAALVEITTATEGATIHYTLDGGDPTAASPTYQAPVTLAVPDLSFNPSPPPQTVRAAAFKESGESIISTATYSLTGRQCGYIWGVIAICEWWGEIGCAYWEWEFVPIGLYCRDVRPPIDGSITIDDVNFDTGVVTVTGLDLPTTGDLKIWLQGQGIPSHALATDPAMGNGTHGYPFQVATIPPGHYNRAYATWTALDGQVYAERSVNYTSCEMPIGETTQSYAWGDSLQPPQPTLHGWIQTLLPQSTSFEGRKVRESDPGGGTDSCHFEGSEVPWSGRISGGEWVVDADNRWGTGPEGPDFVGWTVAAVDYYRRERARLGLPVACAAVVPQEMAMSCAGGTWSVYITNTLKASIEVDQVGSERAGQQVWRVWP